MTYRNFAAASAKTIFGAFCLVATVATAAPASNSPVGQAAAGKDMNTGKPALPALNMQPVIPDDPAKVAAAKEFIALYRPRMDPKGAPAIIDRMMPAMVEREKENNPKLDVKKFEQQQKAELLGRASNMFDMFAHTVSHHFTLQELKELAAFYRSPLGHKLVAETPKIQMEIMRAGRAQAGGLPSGMHAVKVQETPPVGKTPASSPHK